MKLNPPASSSDLEVARQIARRLAQHRRRDDQPEPAWPSEPSPIRPRLEPPPLPRRPALEADEAPPPRAEAPVKPVWAPRAEPPEPLEPPARRHAPPAALPPEPEAPAASFSLPEAPAFERPSWREPEPEREPLEDLTGPGEPTPFEAREAEVEVEPALPEVGVDEPPISPEEMIGEPEPEGSPLDALTEPEPDASPFADELLDAPAAEEEPAVAEEPAAPSWDEIVETCRGLAQTRGAMLIDPAGQVFSSRGDWPAPGPEAIASKLVAMMAKTLKDAPTRSISAPLMGMHLTAWRVPLAEGLVTAAFIGAAPVRADARPAIDAEINRGVSGVSS